MTILEVIALLSLIVAVVDLCHNIFLDNDRENRA